jgi:hypothetical protein
VQERVERPSSPTLNDKPACHMEVTLSAMVPADQSYIKDDDEPFYLATPTGQIKMTIQNPIAAEQFQAGDVLDVTFNRVERD